MSTHLLLIVLGAVLLVVVAGVIGRKLEPPWLDDVLRRARKKPGD